MKKLILIFVVSVISFYLFAAEKVTKVDESVEAYRKAIEAMDAQDYGKALKYSEDAILYRKQRIENQINKLKNSLSAKRVQAAGDHLDPVLNVLNNRKEYETAAIIEYYIKKKGKDYFEDSVTKLLEYLEDSKDFPEAHKIIGDIYKLEGEYTYAEEYYMMALNRSDVLDIPDEKYEILYMLADISRLEGDFSKMETRLLNILAEDNNYRDSALKRSMKGTISANKKDSMEKFFNLYRADSYNCIDAYNQLAEYYHNAGKLDKALDFASLAVITSFSRIIDILYSRNSVYEYENLEGFMQEAALYDDVIEWASRNSAWKSFNILASYSTEAGYTVFSQTLLRVLARYTPETYWQRDAVLQLEHMSEVTNTEVQDQ
jgi:tetratricopeptide (TPR) repeat protein